MRGLLGKTLSHSYSKRIHEKIDGKEYNLIECSDLDSFFNDKAFEALNVTIPYKYDVIKYLDHIDDDAAHIESVNTIVNTNGILTGFNTDINGLKFLLDFNEISILNKTVGIMGNGATSRTIQYLCAKENAKEVLVFARHPKINEYSLDNINHLQKVDILFNATPNGMYPNNSQDILIELDKLISLKTVVDLIYNPLRTKLLIEAEKRHLKAVNGLMMLVHQAVKANEYFNGVTYPKSVTVDIYKEVLLNTLNVVLIGMPMSGKSFYSRAVSETMCKKLIDIDKYLEEKYNKSIPEIFKESGEKVFREMETECISEISKGVNLAISTGGGVVLNSDNIDVLKQNGVVIFLDMSLADLKKCNPKHRPLLKNPKNIEKLFNERYDLYNIYCDKRVVKTGFKRKDTLNKIEVKLDEFINS